MPDSTERFIIKIDDFKQSMGLWYSLFALKIIPIALFIIPVNIVIAHSYDYLKSYYIPELNISVTGLRVIWILVMLGLLAAVIFAPKAATAAEFIIGIAYLVFAFKYHLFTNALGYSLLICVIIFLLVKLIFLVFDIIRLKAFSKDKENNIERDESGRIVRATGDELAFTDKKVEEGEYITDVSDDELVMADNAEDFINDKSEYVTNVADDELFIADSNQDSENDNIPFEADNDFIFGK